MPLSDEVTPDITPGNDFYHHVNQQWIDGHPIPSDKARVGIFEELMDSNIERIRVLIETPSTEDESSNLKLLKTYYRSAMDESAISTYTASFVAGLKDRVSAITSSAEVIGYISACHASGISLGWNPYIEPDDKNSRRYVLRFAQDGLGLPDREYYVEQTEQFSAIRRHYQKFMSDLLELVGVSETQTRSGAIFELESRLAAASMTATERRDPDKTYNTFEPSELIKRYPTIDWKDYFETIGFDTQRTVIISQPDFMSEVFSLLSDVKLETWKDYLLVHSLIPILTKLDHDFEDLHFDFYGKILRGTTEPEPRYRRIVRNCMLSLPEPTGQLFVSAHFDDAAKSEIGNLVARLQTALGNRIDNLSWMSDATKAKAHEKLGTFLPLLGYPNEWRDYSKLTLTDSYADNFQAVLKEEWQRTVSRIDRPVDRREWLMSPALVNAYYWPNTNGITFPAGILQPPFFDPSGDFASNYGAIGAVIGHEITHGFDDEGSKFDHEGNLLSWWTKEDRSAFELLAEGLVKQFDDYKVAGRNVNGKLTLGENIADLGGIQVAYDALLSKLNDEGSGKLIDGYTPQQRFFIGYARSWRESMRPEFALQLLVSDPHAPDLYRVNGILPNLDAFYEAFGVQSEDKLFIDPDQRIRIW